VVLVIDILLRLVSGFTLLIFFPCRSFLVVFLAVIVFSFPGLLRSRLHLNLRYAVCQIVAFVTSG
jgi:hypothetical protein